MAPGRMQLCPLPRRSTYYTQYVAVNVAVNSKVWENKGSLIKIKFLSSHWNKIKIKFKQGEKITSYFVLGEIIPATVTLKTQTTIVRSVPFLEM